MYAEVEVKQHACILTDQRINIGLLRWRWGARVNLFLCQFSISPTCTFRHKDKTTSTKPIQTNFCADVKEHQKFVFCSPRGRLYEDPPFQSLTIERRWWAVELLAVYRLTTDQVTSGASPSEWMLHSNVPVSPIFDTQLSMYFVKPSPPTVVSVHVIIININRVDLTVCNH